MRIFLKKGAGKHAKWIWALLLFSVLYAMIGINGGRSFGQNDDASVPREVSYSIDGNKVISKIPAGQHILLQVSGVQKRQETVAVSFYDEEGMLVNSRDIVLCNGMNDLGLYEEDISFFKYNSAREIDIVGIYYADRVPPDMTAGLKVGVGIFLLCCIQYFLVLLKGKYTG